MTPSEFRLRFLANVAAMPGLERNPGLREEFGEFVSYDGALLQRLGVSAENAAFLTEVGLPRQCPPMLDFRAYSMTELEDFYRTESIPRSLFQLGGNNYGDPLGIELSTQNVVFLNHDRHMERIFINSSMSTFTEALCLCQELLLTKDADRFWAALESVDPEATADGSMWRVEIRSL